MTYQKPVQGPYPVDFQTKDGTIEVRMMWAAYDRDGQRLGWYATEDEASDAAAEAVFAAYED